MSSLIEVEILDYDNEQEEFVEFDLKTYGDGWAHEWTRHYDPEWDDVLYELCTEQDGG